MKIQDAIKRLSYTISEGNKPNDTDKIALNKLIRDHNQNAKESVEHHLLFAKMYAVMLKTNTEFHGDVQAANKDLNKILRDPLEFHLENLRMVLRYTNVKNMFESKGIVDPLLNHGNYERYQHLFKEIDPKDVLSAYNSWGMETLVSHFTNAVNQSILCFKR
jgi:hypothetical protein